MTVALTKDGREKGSGAGRHHLLRGRDGGRGGVSGSPLPHPGRLWDHRDTATERLQIISILSVRFWLNKTGGRTLV